MWGTMEAFEEGTSGAGVVYCDNCGEPLETWCHSQAGSMKAYAWTHCYREPDDADDPRNRRYCQGFEGAFFRAEPDWDEFEQDMEPLVGVILEGGEA